MKLNLMFSYVLWCACIAVFWSALDYFIGGTKASATNVLIVGFAYTWAHHEQKKKDA